MTRLHPPSLLGFAALALSATSQPKRLPAQAALDEPPGLDISGMDRSVVPGDDFFGYANGAWLAHTEIPADRSTYGASAALVELTDRRVAELI